MEPKPIEMAALGRALYPGMLYDCRRDSFIPGVTLWDKASLSKDLDVHRKPKTELKFSASDSLRDKTSLLDVSTSLKASFLSGLVEVEGSARYLHDQKTSEHQTRVTMYYSQMTRFEQLTMTQLGKIAYPEVFEEKTATHVVTAVLYGAQAVMVFDKTVSKDEDKQEVEGNLNLMVKKIPQFSIEGHGAVKLNENEKKLTDNIDCTFYGDYELEENPTTYIEALQLYKKLPSLLRQQESDAVPVKVWLYPLARLDSKAAKLMREISTTVISEVERLLERLGNVKRMCNDMVQMKTVSDFQDVKERLQKFQDQLGHFVLLLQKALSRVLPAIRSGEAEGDALADILSIQQKSPFKVNKLKRWLENVQSELHLLGSYIRELTEVPVITSSTKFNSILFDPMVDTVVCFSFTSLKYKDPYLSAMSEFLTADPFEKSTVPKSSEQETNTWFSNPEIFTKMKENLSLFQSFSEANKEEKKTRFVIASIPDSSNPGISIRLYRQGKIVDDHFQPVSKPPAPSVDVQNRNVVLKLQKSPTGETVRYRVEYRATQPDASGADGEAWEATDTPDTQETLNLTEPQLDNEYWIRYRAVSDVGVSEASESVLFSLRERYTVTVDKTWNWTTSSLFNELQKKIITDLGATRWSLSTIKKEVSHQLHDVHTPYVGAIPGGLRPGMAIYFQGVVHPDAVNVIINQKLGQNDGDDVAFHFNPRINDSLVLDSFRNGRWESPQETKGCPLARGSAFDIFIVINPEGYEAYVNGQMICFFKHRMPIEKVTTLGIEGDVFMNTIGYVKNWTTSSLFNELQKKIITDLGATRWSLSTIKKEVSHQLHDVHTPYVGPIPGGLRPGMAIYFQGVVHPDAVNVIINQKLGQNDGDDVAFHFNPRINDSLVLDSFRNGRWESPQETKGCPLARGSAFDIFIVINPEGYEAYVNGQMICFFKHRMPIEKVTTLGIEGDVFMNTIGYVKNWTTSSLFNELQKKIITDLGATRWSLSTIKKEVSHQLHDVHTPYVGPIPGGLRPGMAIYFQGVVHPDAVNVIINQKLGQNDGDDVAFHFNPRINDSLVLDSFRNGRWESPQETKGCPLARGSAFDIFIVINPEGYEAYVNGQMICFFKHRMPIEKVTTLNIEGDVFMNTIGYVKNWSTSTFGQEQSPGFSRGKLSDTQSGVQNPVCSPGKIYMRPLTRRLTAGLAIFFQGVVPSDADRFNIELKTGQRDYDDIAFHFSPRFETPCVVRNSFRNGSWETEEQTSGGPFVKGGAFDMFMVIKPEGYEVIVNGHVFCMFGHRMPVESVSVLSISKDIFMNNLRIIEVDSVNMKTTII